MVLTNAQHQAKFREHMRNMIAHGVCVKLFDASVFNRRSKEQWCIECHWPDYSYYKLSRTYKHENGRVYSKSYLVSLATLRKNYVDNL